MEAIARIYVEAVWSVTLDGSHCQDLEAAWSVNLDGSHCQDLEAAWSANLDGSRCQDLKPTCSVNLDGSHCQDLKAAWAVNLDGSHCQDLEWFFLSCIYPAVCRNIMNEMYKPPSTQIHSPQHTAEWHHSNLSAPWTNADTCFLQFLSIYIFIYLLSTHWMYFKKPRLKTETQLVKMRYHF
jgi:hypothetical protein